jgi:predicted DNA-binding transcriptional regulator YafY
MRYGPAENLFRLARHLAATRTGLTLDEMAAELEVGRRTAERMPCAGQSRTSPP